MRRRNKYGNRKVTLDGYKFDSIKEANRYAELKLLEKAGEIRDLMRQVPIVIQEGFINQQTGKKEQAIKYYADFTYFKKGEDAITIEDVKSEATRKDKVYRLKKKLLAAKGIYIQEV